MLVPLPARAAMHPLLRTVVTFSRWQNRQPFASLEVIRALSCAAASADSFLPVRISGTKGTALRLVMALPPGGEVRILRPGPGRRYRAAFGFGPRLSVPRGTFQ